MLWHLLSVAGALILSFWASRIGLHMLRGNKWALVLVHGSVWIVLGGVIGLMTAYMTAFNSSALPLFLLAGIFWYYVDGKTMAR